MGYTLAKEVDEASINRARRMERRCRQHLVRQLLESESYSNSSDKKSTSDKLTSAKDKEELVPATGSSDLTEEVNLWKKKCEELEKQISSERRVTEFWITRRRILENTVNQKQRAINNINKELRAIKRKASPKKMCECVQTILRKVFTESQCRILLYDKKKLEWDNESMAIAFRLRYLSKRAYLYLSKTLNYPLPSLSSLRRWAASVNGRQGILSEPLNVMKTTVHAKSCPQVGVYTYKLVVG